MKPPRRQPGLADKSLEWLQAELDEELPQRSLYKPGSMADRFHRHLVEGLQIEIAARKAAS